MSLPAPRRLIGAVLAVALATVGLVASVAAVAPPAAEAATVQHRGYLLQAGPKLGHGTEWMGSYSIDGRPPSYCVDYGKATPRAVGWRDVRALPGWAPATVQRVSYVLSRYGAATSNTQAAAVNAAINLIIGDRRFAADWKASYVPQLARKDPRVAPLATRIVRESATLRGPYKVSVRVTRSAVVGGVAQARVTVTSAAGRPLGGAGLSVRLANAMPARVLPRRTASNGQAILHYVPSAPGAVTATAVVTGLVQSNVLRVSTPASRAEQRVASSAAARVSATSAGRFRAAYPRQRLRSTMVCTQDCYGAPPVDVTATNASPRNRLQVVVVVNGKPVPGKVLNLAPGRTGRLRVVVRDGQQVRTAYRWQQGRGWSRFLPYGATRVVDCPPVPDVALTIDCPCDGRIGASLRDDNRTRYTHVLTVRVPGGTSRTLVVPPRTTRALPGLSWPRGTTVTVWNQNRLAGKNVGAAVRVATVNLG